MLPRVTAKRRFSTELFIWPAWCRSQTADVLAQIDHRLAEAGSNKAHLLRVQIFLADIKDISAMNEVWDAWVTPGTAPPRATVQAALSDPAYRIEIVATAVQTAAA